MSIQLCPPDKEARNRKLVSERWSAEHSGIAQNISPENSAAHIWADKLTFVMCWLNSLRLAAQGTHCDRKLVCSWCERSQWLFECARICLFHAEMTGSPQNGKLASGANVFSLGDGFKVTESFFSDLEKLHLSHCRRLHCLSEASESDSRQLPPNGSSPKSQNDLVAAVGFRKLSCVYQELGCATKQTRAGFGQTAGRAARARRSDLF